MENAKKNTKKRVKTIKEVVIAPVIPVPVASSNGEKIAALMSLQATPGWALILQVLTENKEHLERIIIDGFNPDDGEKLTPEQQDEVRYKIKLNRDLMNTPAGYIEALKQAQGAPVDFDPYYKTNADIIRDNKTT